ncbi:MAG: ABC transporter substrate-binding protein [Deinococcota bacterium]
MNLIRNLLISLSILWLAALTHAQNNLETIRLALDWLPNTNHTGIYVAEAQGWYEEAGINLEILPYSGVAPEIVVTSGRADLAVSSTENVLAAAAAGEPVVSVATLMTTNTAAFAVLADSDIMRPADFAGKTYAAFGAAYETPILETLIAADGGEGTVNSALLSVSGFEALLSGAADIVWIFEGVQGVQAELEDIELRLFNFTDYGLPDYYTPVLASSPELIEASPEPLRAFLAATAKGYMFAVDNPSEAAQLLIEGTPPGTFPNLELVEASQRFATDYYVTVGQAWGYQNPALWEGYPQLLLEAGVFTDTDGQVVSDLDVSALFTNALLEVGGTP